MVIFGLTGSIGMGKTTTAGMLRRLGVPVHDADQTVHRLLAPGGGAVAAVAAAFGPELMGTDGGIDRRLLGARVFCDPAALARLEAILHPLVRKRERCFLAAAARRRDRLAALDVPLLFETHGERRVDATVVVSAPAFVQRARVLARPGMTADRFDTILKRQSPDAVKRRRADFVVPTGLGKPHAFRQLVRIVRQLSECQGRHWPIRREGLRFGA